MPLIKENENQFVSEKIVPENGRPTRLKDNTFYALRNLVYRHAGIFLSSTQKDVLESRLGRRLQILDLLDSESYLEYLQRNISVQEEIAWLMGLVTEADPGFFSLTSQLRAFELVVLPELIAAKRSQNSPSVRIMTAGPGNQTDSFTLAMILRQQFPELLDRFSVDITALFDPKSRIQTKLSRYDKTKVNKIEKNYLKKYFSESNGQYELTREILEMVELRACTWSGSQLIDEDGKIDTLFCRNVLIHLDRPERTRVVHLISQMLNPGGYLFLGEFESIHNIDHGFQLIHFKRAIGYKKIG